MPVTHFYIVHGESVSVAMMEEKYKVGVSTLRNRVNSGMVKSFEEAVDYVTKTDRNKFIGSLEGEQWKPIEGFIGLYEVSNLGRVKSFHKVSTGVLMQKLKGKKRRPSAKDRLYYNLRGYDKKLYRKRISRLVALAFLPNPLKLNTVDHIDSDTTNDIASNLQWMDRDDNTRKAWRDGTNKAGELKQCKQCKLSNAQVSEIRSLYKTGLYTQLEIADQFCISNGHACRIINFKSRVWELTN